MPRSGNLEVGDGWVLVCSDGLWNYASTPAEIRTVLDAALTASPSNLVDVCEHMTAWANAQGGKDNISVTLARLGELPTSAAITPASATEPDPEVAVTAVSDATETSAELAPAPPTAPLTTAT